MSKQVKIAKRFDSVEKMRVGIEKVVKKAASWRNDVQLLAVATLNHAHVHGDWTLLRDLVTGVSKTNGVNKNKLKQWAEAAMNATFAQNDAGDYVFAFNEGMSVKDIDVEAAASVKWYEFKVERVEEVLDLEAIDDKLAKLLARALKQEAITAEQGLIIRSGIAALLGEGEGEAEAEAEIAEAA